MAVVQDWNDRAHPLLEAIYDAEERGADLFTTLQAAEAAGVDYEVAKRTMRALHEARPPYVDGLRTDTFGRKGGSGGDYMDLRLTERGRREIGQWPPGPAEAFIAAIERQLKAEQDPEQRRKLSGLLMFARDVAAGALSGAVVADGASLG